MKLRSCLVAILISLTSSLAVAQSENPGEHDIYDAASKQFRLCRIAIMVAANNPKRTAFPKESVTAMREQIDFLMAENAFSKPPENTLEGIRRVREIESWTLEFGKDIRSSIDTMDDSETLDSTLMKCQQTLWSGTKNIVDRLIVWRTRGMRFAVPND